MAQVSKEEKWRFKVPSCSGSFHRLKDCPQFGKMDPRDRMALVERLKLCVACLTSGHNQLARACRYKKERVDAWKKPTCQASRHHLLHLEGGREQQGQEGH
jgi:hypothetical protein